MLVDWNLLSGGNVCALIMGNSFFSPPLSLYTLSVLKILFWFSLKCSFKFIGKFEFWSSFGFLWVHFVADIILILVTKSGLVSIIREDLYLWKAKTVFTMASVIIGGEWTPLTGRVFSVIQSEVNIPCFYLFAIKLRLWFPEVFVIANEKNKLDVHWEGSEPTLSKAICQVLCLVYIIF